MQMKIKTPVWQRVVCALLATGGAATIGSELLSGRISGVWDTAQWLSAACGTFAFAAFAIKRDTVYRAVASLPAPSAEVAILVQARRMVSALRAYRTEAGATLFEAQAVIAHYYPEASSKRIGETPERP